MKAETNKKVTLEYEGRLETGEIFDSSKHGDHSHPLTFTIGKNEVIPGFENNVIGMEVNEEKEFTINPEDAYGLVDEKLFQEVPLSVLPPEPKPQKGMTLIMPTPQGNIPLTIEEVKDKSVILNLNHPLAGKKLIFKVKLTEVE
jgi:FKBP-type peptidyl-prolyl cis-trans isomerase SlpA